MDEYKYRMGMMRGEFRGDFTRDTFSAGHRYARVLMQQGRVQLDADVNEQASIMVHHLRSLAVDLMGPHAAPAGMDGQPGEDFRVSEPDSGSGHVEVAPGLYYVNGIRCENPEPTSLRIPDEPAVHLVYLDVWERHIAAVEDDLIREVALNGPDTATRAKIECQIKLVADVSLEDNSYATFLDALEAIRKPGTGQLRARARLREEADREPCLVDPEARYRGPENQLYRVEIHTGGQGRQLTFKWSRENSAVYFPIVKPVADRTVTLAHLGRDARFGLQPNDWVEIMDDEEALTPERPPLLQIESIDPDTFEVTFKDAPSSGRIGTELDKHPYLRRWDHKGDDPSGLPVIEGNERNPEWIDLEDGIQIQFLKQGRSFQRYGAGDYWLIPARTITGDVEWPGPVTDPDFLPPHGVLHHYAPLALLTRKADGTFDIRDLRRWIIKLWQDAAGM
jgi:hypothetical protein